MFETGSRVPSGGADGAVASHSWRDLPGVGRFEAKPRGAAHRRQGCGTVRLARINGRIR
jgi:hypothetical protein